MNQQERDATLDADYLRVRGYHLNPQRTMLQDNDGAWWPIAWSYHLGRYESSVSWVDAVLRVATYGGG